jgi:hypothetical protein
VPACSFFKIASTNCSRRRVFWRLFYGRAAGPFSFFHPPYTTGDRPAWCDVYCKTCNGLQGTAESTGFIADLCVFSHFIRRVIAFILPDSCGFALSVRDVVVNIRKMGGIVQCLAIAAYSLNEMRGRVRDM